MNIKQNLEVSKATVIIRLWLEINSCGVRQSTTPDTCLGFMEWL